MHRFVDIQFKTNKSYKQITEKNVQEAHCSLLATKLKRKICKYLNSLLQKLQKGTVRPPKQSHKAVLQRVFWTTIIYNLPNTIAFAQYKTIRKSIVCITARFAPANDWVSLVLVKLAFVAMLSGTVWVDSSSPIFIIASN